MSSSSVNYNLGLSGPQNVFGTGSNQYGAGWPTMQTASPGSYNVPSGGPYAAQTPSIQGTKGGYYTGTTYDPTLTGSLFGYLGSQIGQGLPAYGGQLSAGPSDLQTQLANALSGGQSNIPYANQMIQMAQTGNPTDVGPEWNAMIQAQQQNIAQNYAQLKESMSAGGNLVGTPYGTAAQDYASQTAASQNALLAQLQQQASEAAAGRQLGAQQSLAGLTQALGGQEQQIAQTGLTNAYTEWLRQQPQYNPLLGQAYGAATTFPSYLNPQQSPWAMLIPAILNAVGPTNIGTILQKIPGLGGNTPQTPQTPPTIPGGQTPQQTPQGQTPQGSGQGQMIYNPNDPTNQLAAALAGWQSDPNATNWQQVISAAGLGQGAQTDVPNLLTGTQNVPYVPGGSQTLTPPAGTVSGVDTTGQSTFTPIDTSSYYSAPYGGTSTPDTSGYYDAGYGAFGDASGGMVNYYV